MSETILTWDEKHESLWETQPIKLSHSLSESPLFAEDAIAQLIEAYPQGSYTLRHDGERNGKRIWRQGDIGGLSGKQVLEAITAGRIWLNLRNVQDIDKCYRDLLHQMLNDFAAISGTSPITSGNIGLLISSPNAQVYYHADIPGQALWQIRGVKRVYVYPPIAPFLTPEQLERVVLTGYELSVNYTPWYDDYALVVDLQPGEMMHWPHNSPHRVDNHNCLNVSLTTEYWTHPIRRTVMMNCGNAVLRSRLGIKPHSRATSGPGFWMKAALQAGVRRAGLLDKERKAQRPVTFRLDPTRLGAVIDLPQNAA